MPDNFVDLDKIQVIIPYSSLEKIVSMSHELEAIRRHNARIEEQFVAIRGMFSECLDKIREIQNFVKD